MEWRGVSFYALAELARPEPEAEHLLFKGCDGYWRNNPIEACLEEVRIAHSTSWEVLGFGELKGYSNTANPWKKGRFAESSLS